MPDQTKCLGEDLNIGTLYVGEVSVKNKRVDQKVLLIQILNPNQKYLFTNQNVNYAKFSFTADLTGPHNLCITNSGSEIISVTVDVKIGAAAKDFSNIASTKDIKDTELMLVKISEVGTQIHKEIQHLREREEEMRNTNETIHSRVITYSVMTLFFLICISVIQVLYLKRFFRSKKMI